jgi:hypothetical protein
MANQSSEAFELGIYLSKCNTPTQVGLITPKSSFYIPVPYISDGTIAIKPHQFQEMVFQWSEMVTYFSYIINCRVKIIL